MKRVVALLVSVLIPLAASMAQTSGVIDGTNITWELEGTTLTISGDGEIPAFTTSSAVPWYSNATAITIVNLSGNITAIGKYTFNTCKSITKIITDIVVPPTLEANTFYSSFISQITVLVPPDAEDAYMEAQYWSQMTVEINPEYDINPGTGGEDILSEGYIGDGDAIHWQLYKSGQLTLEGSGMMPDYEDASVQPWSNMRSMICEVSMTGAIGNVGNYAFAQCDGLNTVYLSTSTITIGDFSFSECTNLSRIVIPANEVISSSELAFGYNFDRSSLTIAVPSDMVETYQGAMFWYEFQVVSMDGGSNPTDEVYNGEIGSVFWELKEGQLRLYGEGEVAFGSAAEQPWANYRDQIYKLHISDQVTVIGSYALAECTELNEIFVQGESLDSIGMYAFANCTNLVQITIASEIVVSADANAFSGVTTSNITLSIMEEIMESYQDGVWADMQKSPLNNQQEEVSGLIYENLYWSFNSSEGLLTIYGNGAMPDWIQSMAPWGEYLDAITQVKVGVGVTYVCNGAFAYCENITSVTVAFTVDSIGDNLFTGNNSPIQFHVQNMTPPGITENTFANVQGCVYVYCYESAFSAFQNHPYWSQTCLGYDDDPHYEDYQLSAIYVNGTIISGFDPNLYNYNITLPEGTEAVPEVTYKPANADQVVTIQQATSTNGKAYVNVAVGGIDMATYSIYFSVEGSGSQAQTISLTLNDTAWTFVMLPSALGGMITADDIVADGDLIWGRYNGEKRAANQSGWELVDNFDVSYYKDWGHIVCAVNGDVNLTINLPESFNNSEGTLRLRAYPAAHQQNANWNFVGNPYNAKYDILGQLSKMGIESPIAVWNGTGYTTYTPGIDNYVLQPFEPFFIQVTEDRDIQLTPEYIQQ